MLTATRKLDWLLPFALIALVAAASCSGNAFSASSSATDLAAACQDLATARCNKRVSCTNAANASGASVVRLYGDFSTCTQREALMCENQGAASGSLITPEQLEQCAAALGAATCGDFFDNVPPPACLPGGTRASGQTCAFNPQCLSGYCGGTKQAICGTCATAPGAGADCSTSNCGRDLICVASTNLCESRADVNAACSAQQPCRSGLNCVVSSSDASMSNCLAALGTPGSTCGTGTAGCDASQGLVCIGSKGTRTCQGVTYAGDGLPCGTLGDGSRVECAGGDCYNDAGLAALSDMGTCKAFAADGQSCDTELGPTCLAPARCVTSAGATSGRCTIAIGASCD